MTGSKLTPETVEGAAALTAALFPSEGWSAWDLAASLSEEDRFFLILLDGETVAGCGGIQQSGEEGDVLTVGLAPQYRRQGLGRLLLEKMIEAFREKGGRKLFLEVREGNTPARNLYERCGFLEIHRRKGYYRDPKEDAVIYQLEVHP